MLLDIHTTIMNFDDIFQLNNINYSNQINGNYIGYNLTRNFDNNETTATAGATAGAIAGAIAGPSTTNTSTTTSITPRQPTTPTVSTFNLNDQLVKQQERFQRLQTRLDQPNITDEDITEQCIPPERTKFSTLEEGKKYLKQYMKLAKIGLVICDSRKNSYTSYRCDRGGNYRDRRNINESNRVRKLRTRKCNCQFKLILKLNKLDSMWYLILKNLNHNHKLTNLENLPILRRRDDNIKFEIKLLLDSGIKNPTQIKNFLMTKFDGIVITKRDIYNEIGEYTRKYKK